jgi:hypothetical protein
MIAPNTRLSDYYTVADLTTTSTGIANLPTTQKELDSLKKLASVLDILKRKLGSFRIASGYRNALVNAAVGGSSTSRHMTGEAVDIVPTSMSAEKYWASILADPALRNSLGEISYKKPQNSIHLSLPFSSYLGAQVIGSARVADGSPMVYKSISKSQENDYLAKYNLIDTRTPATIEYMQASTAQAVQNLFNKVAPQTYMGKAVLLLGIGSLALIAVVKRK